MSESRETLDEALGRIARTPKPLAAFVFSRDQKVIARLVGELSPKFARRHHEQQP